MQEYSLTRNQLLIDLYTAYLDAIKHKRHKPYVERFSSNLKENLNKLCDELWNRTYEAESSTCFIVRHPKLREVFAANFRDRIVHHLYFNYTHKIFENTFIHDTYSCIKKRGTHFGVQRLQEHIRSESENYTKPTYILKMDIKGYFMNIDRELAAEIACESLRKMKNHKSDVFDEENSRKKTWGEVIDYDFVEYLTKTIAMLDPTTNCRFKSKRKEWKELAPSKSLFTSPKGCGLPIGNLTSQLFSNIYLNCLDQYCKRKLKCKHYGRYVDDFYVVSSDKEFLHKIIPLIQTFLKEKLHLDINQGKTTITTAIQGVEFLGRYVKRHGLYLSNQSIRRMKNKLLGKEYGYNKGEDVDVVSSVNSYIGSFRGTKGYSVREALFSELKSLDKYGLFTLNYNKFVPYSKISPKNLRGFIIRK